MRRQRTGHRDIARVPIFPCQLAGTDITTSGISIVGRYSIPWIVIESTVYQRRMSEVSDLLNKIRKTLGTGVDVIGTKSKELWDATVIRTRIGDLRARRRGLAEQLGGMVYTMLAEDSLDIDSVKAKAAEITEVDVEIDRAEEELARIGSEAQEKTADHDREHPDAEAKADAAPAPAGAPEPERATEQPEARRCECGAEVRAGARYCIECGRPIPPPPAPAE